MGDQSHYRLSDVDYVCLICPLRPPQCDGVRCLYRRFHRLRRAEQRARDGKREWLSERQVQAMAREIGLQIE